MENKRFYRVANEQTKQGLWYNQQGEHTGLIHNEFNFCKNSELAMDFDIELVGWLSAVEAIEDLYHWFTKEEMIELHNHNYFIYEYEAIDYRFYDRFKHMVISQNTSKITKKIELI